MEWSNLSMREMINSEDNEERYADLMHHFENSYSFWKSSLRYKLAAELFVHALHPLIWMKVASDSNTYKAFQILIFLRMYLGVNLIFKCFPVLTAVGWKSSRTTRTSSVPAFSPPWVVR